MQRPVYRVGLTALVVAIMLLAGVSTSAASTAILTSGPTVTASGSLSFFRGGFTCSPITLTQTMPSTITKSTGSPAFTTAAYPASSFVRCSSGSGWSGAVGRIDAATFDYASFSGTLPTQVTGITGHAARFSFSIAFDTIVVCRYTADVLGTLSGTVSGALTDETIDGIAVLTSPPNGRCYPRLPMRATLRLSSAFMLLSLI